MNPKNFLILVILITFITISQLLILKPHLNYGFSDVDWGFLSIYKTQNPYNPSQFIHNLTNSGTQGGVYTHQIYYIGVQNEFFGLDFEKYQLTSHFFKILATIASFPVFFAITGSVLVAFVSTILFGFSYSAVGTMYTVVTSNDYMAIFLMEVFGLVYWNIIRKKITGLVWLFFALILLFLTLFWSTERMYPLPLFIIITEFFLLIKRLGSQTKRLIVKRLSVLILPLLIIFIVRPIVFLDFILRNGSEIIKRIYEGNWNLLLTPFIALGSIILPSDTAKFFGIASIESFPSFIDYLLTGPTPILFVLTFFTAVFIFKKPHKVILQISILTFIFSIFLYVLASHFVDHLLSRESITQALIGFYILAFALVSFGYWLKNNQHSLMGLFVGPFFAFLYILLTWVGAATSEVFIGAHRYLTIPAMLMSLFLGTLFSLMVSKNYHFLKNHQYLRVISFTPFFLLIFFINLNISEVENFFYYQLYNGFGNEDKQFMRGQLLNNLNNLPSDQPSLFYFDFKEDNTRGYYYDNTILGGFKSWMLWNKNLNFRNGLKPEIFWNNEGLLEDSMLRNGIKGFSYQNHFYDTNHFYAFKLQDKRVIDIKDKLLNKLNFQH